MTNTKTYKDIIQDLKVEFAPTDGDSLANARSQAYARFLKLGFPTRKVETWKYTNIEKILNAPFMPSMKKATEVPEPDELNHYHLGKSELNRLTFVNGNFASAFSSKYSLPKTVQVTPLATVLSENPEQIKHYLGLPAEKEENAFAAINTFSFQTGVFIQIPDKCILESPIHLLFAGLGDVDWPTVVYPRIIVALGRDAKVELAISNVSLNDESYFTNSVADFYLGEGAKLDCSIVQRQTEASSSFFAARSHQQASSTVNLSNFVHGGNVVHNEFQAELLGENAFFNAKGLTVLSGKSQVSQYVLANHLASHCTSRQSFKNVLAGHAQAEFNSIAHVHKGTVGSNSGQLNKNIILADHARAFSRPQLKIDSDEVDASHGSATGQLEEKEIFYLRSRGFSLADAKFLLTFGFAEDILRDIKPASLRWQLELLVRKEIEAILDPDSDRK